MKKTILCLCSLLFLTHAFATGELLISPIGNIIASGGYYERVIYRNKGGVDPELPAVRNAVVGEEIEIDTDFPPPPDISPLPVWFAPDFRIRQVKSCG